MGQGSMGRIWRCRDEVLDREAAVKEVLLPVDLPETTRDQLIARTQQEARAAARFQRPGIVTVFDVVEHGGTPWIIMELIRGSSLAAHLAEHGRLSWERAASVGRDLGSLHDADPEVATRPPTRPLTVPVPGSTTPESEAPTAPQRRSRRPSRRHLLIGGAAASAVSSGVLVTVRWLDRRPWFPLTGHTGSVYGAAVSTRPSGCGT
ncbi:protein kinase domain-containing protein [Streptomyces lavendulae]|uniref:protein kinase domain-containing protein n=1 Tax=Streptomyces lavendulae TaxID=1914 RepID=UPI00380863CC